ncbi:SAM-dependent methyltransferase [Streptomyces sp. NPDC007088]|uniref:SAM-dependent methyltransferase n=1 Tax=Streptomyces sp. NPDC007088 TaxID=3364773 RepID=UPI003690C6B3
MTDEVAAREADAGRRFAVDTSAAHPARVYDWLLGGKDHYPVDQAVAEALPPGAVQGARQNRAFMHRAVKWLARQGVDQFLDIGTGIPTEPNLHQVVQSVNPAARIVYADNDPIVLAHAEALLVSSPEGETHYLPADVREPEELLARAGKHLDLTRPVALSLIALLHFLPDSQDAYGIVRRLVAALPPGSHLVLTHSAYDLFPEALEKSAADYRAAGIEMALRGRPEVARFFDGLDLVPPGLVTASEWHPETEEFVPEPSGLYAGVARVRGEAV